MYFSIDSGRTYVNQVLKNIRSYFTTPLYLVIITEFSDCLWEHIFTIFQRKRQEYIFGILSNSSSRNHCGHFMVDPPKKVRIIQIWALEIFSVEFFHYFLPICYNQRRRGPALARKAIFSYTSSTPTSPSGISTPTGTNTIKFPN